MEAKFHLIFFKTYSLIGIWELEIEMILILRQLYEHEQELSNTESIVL